MKSLLFTVFVFYNFSFFSQEIQVLDSIKKDPIKFATVQFLDKNEVVGGNYTSVNGFFKIDTKLNFNKISISCLGYKPKVVLINKELKTILLQQNNITLEEIKITKKYANLVETTPLLLEKSKETMGFGHGYEIALFINNLVKKERKILSFLFKVVNKNDKDFIRYYRIHFYKNKNNLPGEEVYFDNKIFELNANHAETMEVDLSNYNLNLFEDGIFVSLENLGNNKNNLHDIFIKETITFKMVFSKEKQNTFVKSIFNKNKWYNFSEKYDVSEKVGKNSKKHYNIAFGLKVEKE